MSLPEIGTLGAPVSKDGRPPIELRAPSWFETRLAAHVQDDHLGRPLGPYGARGDQPNDVQMSMHLTLLSL